MEIKCELGRDWGRHTGDGKQEENNVRENVHYTSGNEKCSVVDAFPFNFNAPRSPDWPAGKQQSKKDGGCISGDDANSCPARDHEPLLRRQA